MTTIEGLGDGERHAASDAAGFHRSRRVPVRLLHARPDHVGVGCVEEGHADSDADIREYMSGNLCRCAAYPNIVAAIKAGAVRDEGGVMRPFAYERADNSPLCRAIEACDAGLRQSPAGTQFTRRRHDAARSDEARCDAAEHVIDINAV